MSTRSLTYIMSNYNAKTPLVCLYRQFDGSPDKHGRDLYNIINTRRIVSGIMLGVDTYTNASNGIGCLAAIIIKELKTDVGGLYIHMPVHKSTYKEADYMRVDYVYTVYAIMEWDRERIHIKIQELSRGRLQTIYDGSVASMIKKSGCMEEAK